MKILVAIKRVVDFNVNIHIKPDGSGIETDGVKMSMNPFDEIAVEQAVQFKENGEANEIVVTSIGSLKCSDTLRTALAMGADRGVHVETNSHLEPLCIAKTLHAVAVQEMPDLILLGKQAIDDDANQVPQMLSTLLQWGQGTFVSKLDIIDGMAKVVREIDGGLQTLQISLPCVISTDLRLNKPRFVTLPNLMKAKKKPIETVSLESLGIDPTPRLDILTTSAPAPRQAGQIVNSVDELVDRLRHEAKVI